ncbi:ATP-binding cassette domain-containing protein [Streptomyces sp. NPDC003011]
MAVDPLIELRDVNKYSGELRVLQGIGLTVGKGEVVVVTGPSGPGKSTLCRAVGRLEPVGSGVIELDGQPVPEEVKAFAGPRAEAGTVFESFDLFARTAVPQNVPPAQTEVRGRRKEQAGRRSRELLDRVGVAGLARSAAHRVVFMSDGRTVEDRAPGEFCTGPRGERARDFLSKILQH